MMHSVGDTVGERYRLTAVIGEGGQATVYRADDLAAGGEVAVKMLNLRASRDPALLERVTREQQAMMALAGTNAVRFVEALRSGPGELCLVMELLQGSDLQAELMRREATGDLMSVDRVVEVMAPIVDTLEKAHAVGIVHRDLKPGNIFLIDPELGGGTRLLDFGFARLQSSQQVTKTGIVLGSPHYIAPEMWRGQPGTTDARVDVYALSVVIFRALSGHLPFVGKTLHESLRLATSAERPSLHALRRELPDNVDIWVERALAIEPDERFRSIRACWAEFLWALGRAPRPVAKTEPPPEQERSDAGWIRAWLEAPVNAVPAKLQAAWRLAAGALRRLARTSSADALTSAEGSQAPSSQPTPFVPERVEADLAPLEDELTLAKIHQTPEESDGRARPALGPLPFPSPPPVEAPSGERRLPTVDGETSATMMSEEALAPEQSSEFELAEVGKVPDSASSPGAAKGHSELDDSVSDSGQWQDQADELGLAQSRDTSGKRGSAGAQDGDEATAARDTTNADAVDGVRTGDPGNRAVQERINDPVLVPAADELRVLVVGPESRVSAIGNTVPLDDALNDMRGQGERHAKPTEVTPRADRATGGGRSQERTLMARDDHTLVATTEQRAQMQRVRPDRAAARVPDADEHSSRRSQNAAGSGAKKASSKKTSAKKASVKKASVKKASSKKTSAKKASAKKTSAKKTSAKKASSKKASSKKASAKKASSKKAARRQRVGVKR